MNASSGYARSPTTSRSARRSMGSSCTQQPDGPRAHHPEKSLRSRSTWIHCRSCAGSQPACLLHDSTRSTTRGYSPRRVHGARASRRLRPRPRRMSTREEGAQERISPLGGTSRAYFRGGCARLPRLPGEDETTHRGEKPCQHCPLPGCSGRADRRAEPLAWSRTALAKVGNPLHFVVKVSRWRRRIRGYPLRDLFRGAAAMLPDLRGGRSGRE